MIFVVVDIFRPPNVILGESAGRLEVLERLVVGVYGEWGFAGFEVNSPLANSLDDG